MSEIKYSVLGQSFNNDGNVGTIIGLNPAIGQGVNKDQRIGNKLKYRRLTVKFVIQVAAGASQVQFNVRTIRIIIFQTRTALSAPILITDILDQSGNYLATVNGTAVRSMYDKMFVLVPQLSANQLGLNSGKAIKKIVFRVNNNVTYRDSSSTTSTDVKDQYYMAVLTDALGASADIIELQGSVYTRLSFIDI